MKGPVPIMSRRMSNPLSDSRGTIVRRNEVEASRASMSIAGYCSLKTTVRASGDDTESTGAFGSAEAAREEREPDFVEKRSQLNRTSCMSSGRPLTGALLCHLMSLRSFKARDRRSGDHSQDSASDGTTSYSSGLR